MHIPHSRPLFGAEYEATVKHVIQSGILAQGKQVQQLENTIAQALQLHHVQAVDSGTSALMLAIRALTQHKQGARVGIPAYACASLLFAVKAAGAQPVFIDCNTDLTLDAEQAREHSQHLDILVLVHPFGMVEPLAAEQFSCPIIEDIAQSVGATLHEKPIGSFGDICIGSLYATKPWGGAYGGFIATQDQALARLCKNMSDPDTADICTPYAGHHQLSNIHAALAYTRINHTKAEQEKRYTWSKRYDALFADSTATPIRTTAGLGNHFRYLIRSELAAEHIIQSFQSLGIAASKPVQQPLHHCSGEAVCPQAERAWQHCVSLPLLADMSEQEFEFMQQGIQTCFTS